MRFGVIGYLLFGNDEDDGWRMATQWDAVDADLGRRCVEAWWGHNEECRNMIEADIEKDDPEMR